MKKHDFESTSKKKAKEQTPEMAEREQEILMWMGDIRDDFILEAEDYKHTIRAIKVCQDILF
ncbi:MAG: hypothetical protein ACLR4O_05385 [Lachnospiraceae bacterium]